MFRRMFMIAGMCWAGGVAGDELSFGFATNRVGETPSGFVSRLAGTGEPGDWRMVADEVPSLLPAFPGQEPEKVLKLVLAQRSTDATDERFPMLVYEDQEFGDFKMTTRFKLAAGAKERMAGLAFRVVDERNYYYVRASGLGDTFYFFKVQDGIRSAPIGVRTNIAVGVWHEMSVACEGNRIRATLNGAEVLPELTDNTFSSGKVGFWTKSDSVTYFADAGIVFKPRFTLAQRLVMESLALYPRLEGLKIVAADRPGGELKVVASDQAGELGEPAREEEREVIASNTPYYLQRKGQVVISMPLHDRNGEAVAAVRLLMKRFPGQTEKNALARALPIVQRMEPKILAREDLLR